MTDHQDSEFLYKTQCPDCGSEDNLCVYDDGHGYCHTSGCGRKATVEGFEGEKQTNSISSSKGILQTLELSFIELNSRKIREETCRKLGYGVHTKPNGTKLQVAQYFDQDGKLAFYKYRGRHKNFFGEQVEGSVTKLVDCKLYLQQFWAERFNKRVIITSGELDAISGAEALKFKVPFVSITSGDNSAVKNIKANYRWLDRFDEIILWFDNDESGQQSIPEVAALFEVGKVKTVTIPGVKDISDLKQAGKPGDISTAIYGAVTYAPSGIVNAADLAKDMLRPPVVQIADYPYPEINTMLRGMNEHEIVYHVSGTGVGKTTLISEIQYSLWKQGIKFGVMRFEDDRVKAMTDLMSIHINKRIHLEKDFPLDEKTTLHTQIFGDRKVELFDPETAEWGFESLLGYLRYMHKALECRVVFIDPLSFIVAQLPGTANERVALDKVSMELAQITKRMPLNLQITHHLTRPSGDLSHEEGAIISLKHIRGSGGLAMFANALIGWERDQQGERPDLTRARVLKNRMVGPTGVADILKFNGETGRNKPTDDTYIEPGKKKDKESPFDQAGESTDY